ncbi:hypothetical protein LF1_42350 [Rubripirellula obstinata]|uniref:Uncharacterized protein n=1 Tax=Rubripirellula obstinata TaxID=406547 RepID=A0A5B1CPW3_9BACT|nr:hypothetical protein LF1_42350 [Rubripirellula obstinata]
MKWFETEPQHAKLSFAQYCFRSIVCSALFPQGLHIDPVSRDA